MSVCLLSNVEKRSFHGFRKRIQFHGRQFNLMPKTGKPITAANYLTKTTNKVKPEKLPTVPLYLSVV